MERFDALEVADTLAVFASKLPRVLRALDTDSKLTPTEASVLAVLIHGGPMNIGSLAQIEQVKAPSMTRTVRNLEKRKLVEREVDCNDARGWIIKPTLVGKKLFLDGHRRRLQPLIRWLNALQPQARKQLNQVLPVLKAMSDLDGASADP